MKRLKFQTNSTSDFQKDKGATLVEALISVAIMSFVVIGILSGFSQQQMSTRSTYQKNIAVLIAEKQMEEIFKYPSGNLKKESFTQFVVHHKNTFEFLSSDPGIPGQYRVTTDIILDPMEQMATITVSVEFPLTKDDYPFITQLIAKRSQK